jgi:tetratricopeptide (TPR) repeat protein
MNRHPKYLSVFLLLIAVLTLNISLSRAQDRIDADDHEPSHPGLVHYRLGNYYQLKGNHVRAIAEFSLTIEGLPSMGYAYSARARSYAAMGDYEHAVADYSQAIDLYPDYVSALYGRGRAYAALSEPALAFADYRNAMAQMPDYPLPYWGLGDLYFDAGEYVKAAENYQFYLSNTSHPAAEVLVRLEVLQPLGSACERLWSCNL